MNKKEFVCTSCGYVGFPKREKRGSILISIVLWIFFIVPGLIYSIWRFASKYDACPQCKSKNIIPANSPFGLKMIEEDKLSSNIKI
jgi:rubredoxin